MEALLTLLIYIVVIGVIAYVLIWGLGWLGLPAPFDKVAKAVIFLFVLIAVIYILMGVAPIRLKG